MLPVTLEKIAEVTGGTLVCAATERSLTISNVVRDNRECSAGSLFLCFHGERVDGHDFAPDAFSRGAICALCEREVEGGAYILVESTAAALGALGAYYRSLLTIPIVGVTGSVGKTTAKEMIAAALSVRFNVLKTTGNLNNELGVPLTLLQIGSEHGAAVIEMGISDFGEMTRLGEMARPTICVVTTIGACHLEQLGDLDGVLRAKSEVFATMGRDGTAIVFGDDERLCAFDPGMRKVTFGLGAHNDFRAENVVSDGTECVTADVVTPKTRLHVEISGFGGHLALAAAAAVAVADTLGAEHGDLARGLADYRTVGARAAVENTGYITLVEDCYNANPMSMAASVEALAQLTGRRVAVLGDMAELGAGSDELHRELGAKTRQLGIDCLICCGARAEFIYKGWLASDQSEPGDCYCFPFKHTLIENIARLIQADDTVLVKASHSMGFDEVAEYLRGL